MLTTTQGLVGSVSEYCVAAVLDGDGAGSVLVAAAAGVTDGAWVVAVAEGVPVGASAAAGEGMEVSGVQADSAMRPAPAVNNPAKALLLG